MLTRIREKATGWIAWAIVILISIPFALWGVNSYFQGASKIVVATAEGVEIEQPEYQQAMAQQRRSLVQLAGSNIDETYFSSDGFKRGIIDQLIDEALQAEYIGSRGYRISDQELNLQIQSIPVFQIDGIFDSDRYHELIDQAGFSIPVFEEQQRRVAVSNQVESSFVATAFTSPAGIDRALQLLLQERNAHYAILDLASYLKQVTVTDDEVKAEYERHSESYYLPAEIQVDYLELSVTELASKIVLEEDEIHRVYDENQERFSQPTSRRVSHILISVAEDAEDAIVQVAKDRAVELTVEARDGEDFSVLAEVHSDDVGSARQGGDLGIIKSGVMPASFEETLLSLDEGDVSDPIRTPYGFHVIKLTRLVNSKIEEYENVREEIANEIRRQEAESRFVEMAEDLLNISYEQPDSLEPAALALELKLKQSGWFPQESADGFAAPAVIRQAAFSDEVLVDGLNSELIEVDVDTFVVMRKAGYRKRRLQTLSQVRNQVVDHLREQQASSALDEVGHGIVAKLQGGSPWEQLLSEYHLQNEVFPLNNTENEDPTLRTIRLLIYAAPAPGGGGAVYGGSRIDAHQFAIYELTSVIDGDPSMASTEQKSEVRALMLHRGGEELLASFQRGLRTAADVKIYPDQL